MKRVLKRIGLVIVAVLVVGLVIYWKNRPPEPGTVQDEALAHGRMPESFPGADEPYFKDMDRGVQLTTDEEKGRNNWIVWTGGNDRFWDYLANHSFGALDFLKTISSEPSLAYHRDHRFRDLGLVNEPCFEQAKEPGKYGLWLDVRKAGCGPDPFENETKYPGVKFGARGKNMPVGSYYGMASGIVGLRLFPNPDFDEAAAKKWDPKRFFSDASYYGDKDLVRPYRVGMSCGFCHVGPNPVHAPKDPENPTYADLSSNPGAQYFWTNRILFWEGDRKKDNFVWQLFTSWLPGTLDTSFVSSDNINNPRTMNAVYHVKPRLDAANPRWRETLAGGGLLNKQFNDYDRTKVLAAWFQTPDTVFTPRVLKDGSDSVGVLGALNRVYLNIGLFSEEWLLHFRPLTGGKKYSPIRIADAEKNSTYWKATEAQTPDVALFFLKTAQPDSMSLIPGAVAKYVNAAKLPRGKIVFAENCARCHSSKQPPNLCELGQQCQPGATIENTAAYFDWMRAEVQKPDFLDGNYLSTEKRIPVTELGTNACSPLATNAIEDNIWDNFSSRTYKDLPSAGTITVYNPVDGTPWQYNLPAGGRGYTRPPSLISVWSSAPYLLNNSAGKFTGDPSVEGRMAAFEDGIHKMLWPELRDKDPVLGSKIPGPSLIQRTTETSYLSVAYGYLPDVVDSGFARGLTKLFFPEFAGSFTSDGLRIGPIPKGTPVGLLANLDITPASGEDLAQRAQKTKNLIAVLKTLVAKLKDVQGKSDAEAAAVFKDGPLVSQMLAVSKCPDFVVNKGHYFGTNLSDEDKNALIEFLKTF